MENELFLHASHVCGETVRLAIGSRTNKRVIVLAADDALKLAYRLMSLAKGGETHGFERFDG
jgi:hypothetical protein